jgi:homopolymeric O-antigen transport system permease protein
MSGARQGAERSLAAALCSPATLAAIAFRCGRGGGAMIACRWLAHRRRLIHTHDVLRELVTRDFKLRYKRSILGIAWSLLVPLAELAVFYLTFHRILLLNIPHYTTFLFTGILPWTWLHSSLMSGTMTVVDNRELVKQVGFPLAILPVVPIVSQLIHFLLALPILAICLWVEGYHFTLAILALPLVISIQFVLLLSLSYVLSTFQVKFRDTQYLLGITLFLFFYLTPVFYDSKNLPPDIRFIFRLNPMVTLLDAYRHIFVAGHLPEARPLFVLAATVTLALMAGYTVFVRSQDHFVEEL